MKKIFTLFLLVLLCSLNAAAQEQVMRVNKTDGTALTIAISAIESVDFPEFYNLSINNRKWCLHPGQQVHLELNITEEGSTCAIDADGWETSDASVATVDATGAVTAVGEGIATITGRYESGTATMQVKVTTESAFDLTISDIKNTSCSYSITPKNPDERYYCNIRLRHGEDYSIDSMEDHGSMEENIYFFTLDWYKFVADAYGDANNWNSIMQEQLEKGTKSGTSQDFFSSGLVPGETYALYVLGFDKDGYLSTPVELTEFTTTAPQQSDITFKVSIDRCLSTDAQFTVTPSNNDPYLVCVQRANYVDWFIEHDKVEDMVQPMIESFAHDSRYPALQRGTQTLLCSDFVNVRSNEDYYVIVFGYDDGQTSPVTLKHFVTKYGWTDAEDENKGDIIDVTPPASLVTVDCVFTAYDYYLDENEEVVYEPFDPMAGEIGTVGNDVYMRGMFGAMTDKWMKGTYDPTAHTLTFQSPQYMGKFNFWGEGPEDFYACGGNLDNDEMCPLVFDYDPATGKFALRDNLALIVNGEPFSWSVNMMMLNVGIVTEKPLF